MRLPSDDFDGVIWSSWKVEHGHLVRRQRQPSQDSVLQFNQELRRNPGAVRPMSFMGLELNIPAVDLRILWKKYPALNSTNGEEKTAAWRKFMGSSEADPYRVRDRSKARG